MMQAESVENSAMVTWNWTTNSWECDACEGTTNRPLANFCAQCGQPATGKTALAAAPVSPAESRPPAERLVPLRNPDLLLNAFGVALVAERINGNATVFPDPLRESNPFSLPRISEGIAQARFDQWWVYVLDRQGTIFVFPVSALGDRNMCRNIEWRRCAKGVDKFWLFGNRLLILDTEGKIKIGDVPSISDFWAEEREIIYSPSERETPFAVETLVPLRGEDFLLALVGENKMALLSDEGVSSPYEGVVNSEGNHWIGSNREGMMRLLGRLGNGAIQMVSFGRDDLRIHQDSIRDLKSAALYTIDIDGQGWFVAVVSDHIHLVDPLRGETVHSHAISMRDMDMCASFGNLVAGFHSTEDGSPQLALFHFDRNRGISTYRLGSVKTDLVTAPAGFGHRVYVLTRERNTTKLQCYFLGGD
ncbi:MAG: hypothetical protein OXH81_11080 [Gemmatimonadetes bacterium]|nr:hypothetical protein [Gemmatimonadota bacterium]